MSETTPETPDPTLPDTPETPETPGPVNPQPTADPGLPSGDPELLADPPADVDSDTATGWAVYDRRLARFVGGVTADKPGKRAAAELAGGRPHAVVRV